VGWGSSSATTTSALAMLAEGVETDAEAAVCRHLGFVLIQG
jgi:EAL domain-containing protein (putative c-di-GMP-specific phosphodiesterase class I)